MVRFGVGIVVGVELDWRRFKLRVVVQLLVGFGVQFGIVMDLVVGFVGVVELGRWRLQLRLVVGFVGVVELEWRRFQLRVFVGFVVGIVDAARIE
jgi:hypothetical protein